MFVCWTIALKQKHPFKESSQTNGFGSEDVGRAEGIPRASEDEKRGKNWLKIEHHHLTDPQKVSGEVKGVFMETKRTGRKAREEEARRERVSNLLEKIGKMEPMAVDDRMNEVKAIGLFYQNVSNSLFSAPSPHYLSIFGKLSEI